MQFLVKRLVPLSSKFKISNTSVYQRKSFQVWKNLFFFKLDLWAQIWDNRLGVTSIKMKFVSSCGLFQINQSLIFLSGKILSSTQIFPYQLIKQNVLPYTINKYLRDGVKIYLHLLVSHQLLHLNSSGIINVSK